MTEIFRLLQLLIVRIFQVYWHIFEYCCTGILIRTDVMTRTRFLKSGDDDAESAHINCSNDFHDISGNDLRYFVSFSIAGTDPVMVFDIYSKAGFTVLGSVSLN
jgi:hypothetical protein